MKDPIHTELLNLKTQYQLGWITQEQFLKRWTQIMHPESIPKNRLVILEDPGQKLVA